MKKANHSETWLHVAETKDGNLYQYKASMGHLAFHTRRLYLQPLTQADRHMHKAFDMPFRAQDLFKRGERKLKRPVGEVYLVDVLDFLGFIRRERPWLAAPVALAGLAGMAVTEALRLSWDRVDLERGLVEISGETKNEHRERVIPVCGDVLQALRRAHVEKLRREKGVKIQEMNGGPVVVGKYGSPYVHHDSYHGIFKRALRAWNPEMASWAPKDLRNCVLTFLDDQGLRGALAEEYVGHAVGGVSKKHYVSHLRARSRGHEEALQKKMAAFRRFVIEPLEEGVEEARRKLASAETCKRLAKANENAAG